MTLLESPTVDALPVAPRQPVHVVPTASASDLLAAMSAAPAGRQHSRLRDRAIEAWLPLARHLAHR
ncbi:RNA polymerase sigma factor SigF, partial [Actinoplanes subglobosus]